MKLKFFPLFRTEVEIVASGGEARLIKYLDGKVELRGGSKEDRLAAREWISLFWHEMVVGEDSGITFITKEQGKNLSDRGQVLSAARVNHDLL